MISLAKFSIRRPKAALAIWLVVALVLSLIGLGVDKALSPSITVVPGTQSSRAQQLANAQFGPSQLVPILLEGPKSQLDTQGPKLVVALTKRAHTRVLSAWDAGSAAATLRPKPTAAMIVVSVDRPEKDVVNSDEPQIESLVARQVSGPVKAYVTGQPSIDRALKDASLSNLRRTELIAIGILFVLLLVGLRAPVAAAVVTAVGAISVLAGFGEVALLGRILKLDPVGVALGTMTGLAAATAFALLILDRFHREQDPHGRSPRDAAAAAMRDLQTTGRAVLIGGTALVLALAIAAIIGPSQLMISLGTGMLTCAAFATGGAVVVMPAALVLLGHRIDAFSFPAPAFLVRAWGRLVDGGNIVTRHAVYAGFAATALLAVLALPALQLASGPPDVSQLPASAKARIAFQEVSRVMGPGWATPYDLIVVAPNRPLTTPALLASLDRFQTNIAKVGTVASVTGPGVINTTSAQLSKFWPGIQSSAKISKQSKQDLLKLIDGLGQAGTGSAQLRAGLASASAGATQLHTGSGQAQSGAGQLHAGLAQAKSGSDQLAAGLSQALAGATALKNGAAQALNGSTLLANGIGQAHTGASQSIVALKGLSSLTSSTSTAITGANGHVQTAASQLNAAIAALGSMTTGKSDPNYAAAAAALQSASSAVGGLSSQLSTAAGSATQANALAGVITKQAPALANGLGQLQSGASQLENGIKQLRDGNTQLATGMTQLSSGGGQLTNGLGQLTSGAAQLQAGLTLLYSGTGQLASGLAGGVGPAGQLVTGLGTMQAAVIKARGQIPSTKDLETLQSQSPGLFSSGYFVLAAVDGAPAADRNAATFTINLLRGGTAGQIVVVSKYKASDARSEALGTQLVNLSEQFGKQNNVQVAVGGPAGSLGDLTSVTKSRIWLDVAVTAVVLTIVLALALRALLLPAVAIVLSLLVTAACFGVLQLLFGGTNPPLGGPGYLDPMSIIGIFTIAFGITVTYSALLLMRTREAYVAGDGNRPAVRVGLRETAAAATGAGLVMIASLIPFATSDLINLRAFGIGVALAVLLEVLLARPVLLPAAEAVLGRFGWWPTSSPHVEDQIATRPHRPRRPHLHLPRRPGHASQ
jgi:putative drug exporter of the RND superfamily